MDFTQYVSDVEKTYNYRIKTVADVTEQHAVIERFLKRYHLIAAKEFSRSIIQKNPIDFPSIQNRCVFIMDFTLGMPVSPYILERDLVGLLGIPGSYLVVRGENDPLSIQIQRFEQEADIKKQAEEKDLTKSVMLSTDPQYPEADQTAPGSNYYGDGFNALLLKHLGEVAKERHKQEEAVHIPSQIFTWLDVEKPPKDENFNKDVAPPIKFKLDPNAKVQSKTGNFDDEDVTMKAAYQTKAGKSKTLSSKPDSIKG